MEFITKYIAKTEVIASIIILLVSIFLCSISKKIVYRIFNYNSSKEIVKVFAENKITIPYNQVVVHNG